ncbi:MAG: DUF1932 domain-containing protein [Rhodospirillales bacterium]|nr:DUF1932 domain-containing protein [Rhodospirillales bacterium]
MAQRTIAILSPGDMGGGVGAALARHGHDVITCVAGRSQETRARAERLGFRLAPDPDSLLAEAELVLSILPPEAATGLARDVAAAMRRSGSAPAYADCNAVSPETARTIGALFEGTGAPFIDAGIIGFAPRPDAPPTRFYVSGEAAGLMDVLDGKDMSVRRVGPEIGRASAVKMCYASITKGTNALHTAAMTVADALGVGETVRAEIGESLPAIMKHMRGAIPRLPADAGRWVGEMDEIASTYASAGVTPRFHQGAGETFRLLDSTPYGRETRETMDTARTLEDTIAACLRSLPMRGAAE